MLGSRLREDWRGAGAEPYLPPPLSLGPLTEDEEAARLALGEDSWRSWVARGWYDAAQG